MIAGSEIGHIALRAPTAQVAEVHSALLCDLSQLLLESTDLLRRERILPNYFGEGLTQPMQPILELRLLLHETFLDV